MIRAADAADIIAHRVFVLVTSSSCVVSSNIFSSIDFAFRHIVHSNDNTFVTNIIIARVVTIHADQ